MPTIRPNAEPAATSVQAGDIFLIDGAAGVRAFAASALLGYMTTVTAGATTTLTSASTKQQFFTGSTTQTVLLPVTSTLALGQGFLFDNDSTGAVTVQSSGANTVLILAPGTRAFVECILLTGTTAASWDVAYLGSVVASGKVLTVSNSLTLVGTDATVLTFPTTSATIARTDAGQTFTGTNAFGVLTATTINGLAVTASTGTLTIAALKTLTASNSLTLAGTDATTITFQGSDTYMGRATTDTMTNKTFDTAGTGNSFKINGTAITANTGTGSNVLATTPTLNQANLVGTITNDNAAAGSVGEYIESVIASGSATALTTATAKTITSISLTAGDWDVSGNVGFVGASSASVTQVQASISLTTNTVDLTAGRSSQQFFAANTATNGVSYQIPVGPVRFSLASTTTIFLIGEAGFTVGTESGFGIIRARRIR